MSENNYAHTFFLKTPKKKQQSHRYIYLRIIINGKSEERSIKKRWDANRWDQKAERASDKREDARAINLHLDTIVTNITNCKTQFLATGKLMTRNQLLDHALGTSIPQVRVLEEFQQHNDDVLALVEKNQYAKGTYTRYVTARSHVKDFILFKYKQKDLEFSSLNFEFIKDYDFYLRTVRSCSNNTALKYISNFKKIVLGAIDKEIISSDPFKRFKGTKEKIHREPLTEEELFLVENKKLSNPRLELVRDMFVFQCYTGLAYIDLKQLKDQHIKIIEGNMWIITGRQKTGTISRVPLLPKALEIMEKYKNHPTCLLRGSKLPITSNQKMNEYIKEVAVLSGVDTTLHTHRARRTFASTVALNNGVPMHVVKELLGHLRIQQTEEYAITTQKTIGREMNELKSKLNDRSNEKPEEKSTDMERLQQQLLEMQKNYINLKNEMEKMRATG